MAQTQDKAPQKDHSTLKTALLIIAAALFVVVIDAIWDKLFSAAHPVEKPKSEQVDTPRR